MAFTISATQDPWYTPTPSPWPTSDVISGPSGYYEQNPDAYWTKFLNERQGIGLANTSPYAQYVRSQYTNAQKGFQTSLAEDPTLTWQRYLTGRTPDFQQQFQDLAPGQRGENAMRYGGPVRTIADL